MKTWTDEDLCRAVATSNNMSDVLRKLNIRLGGGSFTVVKAHINRLGLSIFHFKITPPIGKKYDLKDILIENSPLTGSAFRRRILKCELIEYICQECGNPGSYNGKELTLQLDHRNGIDNDNRLDNLRFLCPNCHSQTSTYARTKGKLMTPDMIPTINCDGCDTPIKRDPTKIRWNHKNGYKVYCTHECSVLNR